MNLRRMLWIPFLLIALFHAYLMIQWMSRWGFVGAITHWFQTFEDPISAAAGLDLIGLMTMAFALMIFREGRWTRTLTVVIIPFVVFPSLGLLLYLIISERTLPGENSLSS